MRGYSVFMIQSFADKASLDIFNGDNTPAARKALPTNLWGAAADLLDQLNSATKPQDMAVPKGNRLKKLKESELYSVRINDQYRITFKFEGGNALEVEVSKHYGD